MKVNTVIAPFFSALLLYASIAGYNNAALQNYKAYVSSERAQFNTADLLIGKAVFTRTTSSNQVISPELKFSEFPASDFGAAIHHRTASLFKTTQKFSRFTRDIPIYLFVGVLLI